MRALDEVAIGLAPGLPSAMPDGVSWPGLKSTVLDGRLPLGLYTISYTKSSISYLLLAILNGVGYYLD